MKCSFYVQGTKTFVFLTLILTRLLKQIREKWSWPIWIIIRMTQSIWKKLVISKHMLKYKISTINMFSILHRYYSLQGLMNLAFLFASANQLRHAIQLNQRSVIWLLIFSLVLQVTAAILLMVEHMAVSKNRHSVRKRFEEFLYFMPSIFFAFSESIFAL